MKKKGINLGKDKKRKKKKQARKTVQTRELNEKERGE